MVNNTTNIIKTNNHLSPKESLNSDGQLYHQYHQNEQPPLISRNWTQQNATTYGIGISGSCLEQEQTCVGVKSVKQENNNKST